MEPISSILNTPLYLWSTILIYLITIIYGYKKFKLIQTQKENGKQIIPNTNIQHINNIHPVQAGIIYFNTFNETTFNAAIVNLASKNLVKIISKKKKVKPVFGIGQSHYVTIINTSKNKQKLHKYDQILLNSLFPTNKQLFVQTETSEFRQALRNASQQFINLQSKFFEEIPSDLTPIQNFGLAIINYIGLAVFILFTPRSPLWISINLPPILILNYLISHNIKRRIENSIQENKQLTEAGKEKFYELQCIKEFLITAEKEKINWESMQNNYPEFIAYAMILKIKNKFSKILKSSSIEFLTGYHPITEQEIESAIKNQ